MKDQSLIGDARKFETGWRIWFWVLMLFNLIAPLFFFDRVEAWTVMITYVAAGSIVTFLHRRIGWVRLLGVSHFPWFALLPWLVFRYLQTNPEGAFSFWILSTILIDTTALAIDVVDVIRYIKGDRAPIVPRR
jgi:hypothetical protein